MTLPANYLITQTDNPVISGVEVQDYTLSSLLDYNKSDKKERVFEVSLFAEILSEMFQRHFALLILRALIEADGESEVCSCCTFRWSVELLVWAESRLIVFLSKKQELRSWFEENASFPSTSPLPAAHMINSAGLIFA